MDVNFTGILAFIICMVLVLGGYYRYILTVDQGEDKKMKMVKRVLALFFLFGLVQIYSITDNVQLKQFFVVVFAVFLNMWTTIHSTQKCDFPRMYVIRLTLFSAFITLFIAGMLWYSSNQSLFGFVFSDSKVVTDTKVAKTFKSTILDKFNLKELDKADSLDCPDPDSENYDSEMSKLNDENASNSDKQKYRDCLEKSVRDDMAKGI